MTIEAPRARPTLAPRGDLAKGERRPFVAIVAVFALVAAAQVLSIRPGIEWGDDFAMYVLHARNLAEGRPYADTGYVYNPDRPQLGPRTYPPIWPMTLSLVHRAVGSDMWAMKMVVAVCSLAFVMMVYVAFKGYLADGDRLVLAAAIGLSPYLLAFKDSPDSDMLFAALVYACLWTIDRACRANVPPARRMAWFIATGALMYLAYGTRTLGIALPPTLLAYAALRTWRGARPTPQSSHSSISRAELVSLWTGVAVALIIFAAGACWQAWFVESERSYVEQLRFDFSIPLTNMFSYLWPLGGMLGNGSSMVIAIAFVAVVAVIGLLGAVETFSRGVRPFECFACFYLVPVLLWPPENADTRFLIPILPILGSYVLAGARSRRLPSRWSHGRATALLTLCLALSYALRISHMSFGDYSSGPETADSRQLFAWIESHTKTGDVFVFTKPRALTLYTGRPAATYHIADNDEAMWRFLREIQARYLVEPRDDAMFDGAESTALLAAYHRFIAAQIHQLSKVFENDQFRIYRVDD